MKIGILSDSHGQVARIQTAVEVLQAAGAEVLVHCGDVGSVECLTALSQTGLPCYAVEGNMDFHIEGLADAATACGVNYQPRMVTIALGDGRTLVVTHGNDSALLEQLIDCDQHAYVCIGHTHRPSDTRDGSVRIINPGALARSRTSTVALLDTDTDKLDILPIARTS